MTYGGGLLLSTEMTQYMPDFISPVYAPKWGAQGKFHRSFGDLMLGAESILVPEIEAAGRAAIYSGKPTDIPVVGFTTRGKKYSARIIVHGFRWNNVFDTAAQKVANRNKLLPTRDFVSMGTRAIEPLINERIHEIVWAGDQAHGLDGLFSAASVTRTDIPIGTDLYAMDAVTIYNTIRSWVTNFMLRSLCTPRDIRLFVPVPFLDVLAQPFPNFGSSPLNRLTEVQATTGQPTLIREITPINELSSDFLEQFKVHATGDNRDRVMIVADPPVDNANAIEEGAMPQIHRHFYEFDRTTPRQATDLEMSFVGFSATTGVAFDAPFCAQYYTFKKSTLQPQVIR